MNELLTTLSKSVRLCLSVGVTCWVLLLAMETHVMPRFVSNDFIGMLAVGSSIGFVLFMVLYLILLPKSQSSEPAKDVTKLGTTHMTFQKGVLIFGLVIIGLVFVMNIVAIAVPNYLSARETHTLIDEGYSFSTAPQTIHHKSNFYSFGFALLVGLLSCLAFALLTMAARKSRHNATQSLTINENEALRELMRMQDRMEQRIENLETILLSRTHSGVPTDKF